MLKEDFSGDQFYVFLISQKFESFKLDEEKGNSE